MKKLIGIFLFSLASLANAATVTLTPGQFKTWGGGVGKVAPGDTLYILDTHRYVTDFTSGQTCIAVSGTPEAPITIRGDYPGRPGVIDASQRILASQFTDNADGTFSASGVTASQFAAAWIGDPTKTPRLLKDVADRAACVLTDGSYCVVGSTLTVNPYMGGAIDEVHYRWTPAWNNRGQSHIRYIGLKFFGASNNRGNVTLAQNYVSQNQPVDPAPVDVEFIDCEMGFSLYTNINIQNSNSDNIRFIRCKVHNAPAGWYPYGTGNQNTPVAGVTFTHSRWRIEECEGWSGDDQQGIFKAPAADRAWFSFQNVTDSVFINNHYHDGAGDFAVFYCTALGLQQNNLVEGNTVERLWDEKGAYGHCGVVVTGSNHSTYGERNKGLRIQNNLFSDLRAGSNATWGKSGAAARIKCMAPGPLVEGNTFSKCQAGIHAVAVPGFPVSYTDINNVVIP